MANQADQILQALTASFRSEVGELRTFIDRRLAELRAKVHASAELMDMGQLPASTTHTVALELQVVTQVTEAATNKILTAAETISTALQRSPVALSQVSAGVSDIFEACTVLDVTGQRIHRAIDHLHRMETLLSGMSSDTVSTRSAATNLPQ